MDSANQKLNPDIYYIDHQAVDEATKKKLEELCRTPKRDFWIKKRVFDVIVSSICLLILLPLFIIISIAIVIDDPHAGPFYSQTRIGRHGKPFKMFKFRSMYKNADELKAKLMQSNEADGPAFKIKNDPRITKVGKIIRAISFDELPQFFNVLKGDMSVVGPRPPLPEEFVQYDDYQKLRLVVTPGITCYWQIQDNRNDISFSEWVNLDIDYILNRTAWLDLKLISVQYLLY